MPDMPKYRDSAVTTAAFQEPSGGLLPAACFPTGVTVVERLGELVFHWPDDEGDPTVRLEETGSLGPTRRVTSGVMLRREDQSGVSGTGVVADFAEFPSGRTVLEWRNDENENLAFSDTGIDIRPTIEVAIAIHGHGGRTEFIYDNGQVAEADTTTET